MMHILPRVVWQLTSGGTPTGIERQQRDASLIGESLKNAFSLWGDEAQGSLLRLPPDFDRE